MRKKVTRFPDSVRKHYDKRTRFSRLRGLPSGTCGSRIDSVVYTASLYCFSDMHQDSRYRKITIVAN